jgi:hypothetical protein
VHPLLVLPSKFVPAWNGDHSQTGTVDRFALQPTAALWQTYRTDAHFVQYAVPGQSYCPRLAKTAIAALAAAQAEPVMLWCAVDVDNPAHSPWSAELWADVQGRLARLPEASSAGFYVTRGGYRLVWPLATPVPASHFEDWKRQFHAHLETHGILADRACIDWTRAFRLPFVVRDGQPQQLYADFQTMGPLTWIPPRPPVKGSFPATYLHSAGFDGAAEAMPDLTKLSVRASDYADLKSHTLYERLRDGASLAGPGSRNTVTIQTIGAIINRCNTSDPYTVFRLLYRSVDAQVKEGSKWGLTWLWERCVYFCNLKKGEAEVLQQAHELNRAVNETVSKTAAEVLKVRPEDVTRYLIACTQNNFYVFNEVSLAYGPPRPQREILHGLRRNCPTLCPATTNEKTGANLADNELIARYGFPVVKTVMVLGQQGNTIDVESGTLYEGCGAIRADLAPEFNPDIDTWLTLLGGRFADKLKDWLAVLPRFDSPVCALYIHGEHSVGKGMLAEGLAQLWGTAFTNYAELTASFNQKILDCPLIVADEKVPVNPFESNTTAVFRQLIATTLHTISRKHKDAAVLRGSLRLLITANNADALHVREDLTKEDLDAIMERLGYIHASGRAGEFLESIGGRASTESWVAGGGIARHVLWLAQNRAVQPGPRFLVHGWNPELAIDLITFGGLNGTVLTALVYYLTDSNIMRHPLIIAGGGRVLVNGKALLKLWGILFNQQQKPPEDYKLANALSSLSTGQVRERVRGEGNTQTFARFWNVNPEGIYKVAERNNIADRADLEAIVNGPVRGAVDESAPGFRPSNIVTLQPR